MRLYSEVDYFFHSFLVLVCAIVIWSGLAGGSKPATLDTGAVVSVPLFIERGEEILVDTRTGQYMSRA